MFHPDPLRRAALAGAALLGVAAVVAWQVLSGWPAGVTVAVLAASAAAGWRLRRSRLAAVLPAAAFLLTLAWVLSLKPRNDRDWRPEMSVLPRIDVEGDGITIHGLRSFRWRRGGAFDPAWQTRTLDLRDLRDLELVVEPFGNSGLMAHTMLDFGFGSGGHVIVSVEARREQGETYGLIAGCLRQFELLYVFADERDPLTLRAVGRGSRVHVYPVRAEPAFVRRLFLDLAGAANDLHRRPRFYGSVRDNCTTTLARHVDRHRPGLIGWRLETLFPARSGRLLHRLGLPEGNLSWEEAQRRFRADERIRQFADAPDFSLRIRETTRSGTPSEAGAAATPSGTP
jgi:hypothetical protein